MDSKIQVQLDEDEGGSTRQSWMETSGLWTMLHWEQQGISGLSEVSKRRSLGVFVYRHLRFDQGVSCNGRTCQDLTKSFPIVLH